MKKFEKIIVITLSIVGILLSFCTFSLYYQVPFITNALYSSQILPYLEFALVWFYALVGLALLMLIFLAVFMPDRSNYLILKKTKGALQFSKKTVESTALYSFSDLDQINHSEVKAKFYKDSDKTAVQVKLSLKDKSDLVSVIESVQNRIETALNSSLGINVKNISVIVIEPDAEQKNSISNKEDIKMAESAESEGDAL